MKHQGNGKEVHLPKVNDFMMEEGGRGGVGGGPDRRKDKGKKKEEEGARGVSKGQILEKCFYTTVSCTVDMS